MSARKSILVITGVPGTGKTSLTNSLKRKLHDAEVIHTTELVNKKNLFSKSKDGAKVVRMPELRGELERQISKSKSKIVIIEGHLLCDLRIKGAKVVVLREHLLELRKRLKARGYSDVKISANIVSEATDYCGIRAERNYGYVFESFVNDKHLVSDIIEILAGKKPKGRKIELLPEFDRLLRVSKSAI